MNHSAINRTIGRRNQGGIVLLEALIAIALFAFGVLGLVALQANAVKESGKAKFRADASLLADELIGKMWVSNRDDDKLAAAFASPNGTEYATWKNAVVATLPGASSHAPDVTISKIAGGGSGMATASVSVTLYWKAPHEQGDEHRYTVVTQIR